MLINRNPTIITRKSFDDTQALLVLQSNYQQNLHTFSNAKAYLANNVSNAVKSLVLIFNIVLFHMSDCVQLIFILLAKLLVLVLKPLSLQR